MKKIIPIIIFIVFSNNVYAQLDTNAPWPMFQQNNKHTGSTNENIVSVQKNPIVKWSFITGDGIGSSPAIGSDGTIYVGSFDNKVYAINPNGTEKWSFITGGDIRSSPAIGADGTIYVGSRDNKLYAITNGAEKWSFVTDGRVDSSPAIGADGTIYVGKIGAAPGTNGDQLLAINPNGTEKWSIDFGFSGYFESNTAIGNDGLIYININNGFFYAITTNSVAQWSNSIPCSRAAPTIGNDNTVYFGDCAGQFQAIKNGLIKWSINISPGWVYSSSALDLNGTIYVGASSGDNTLYAIIQNNEPELLWSGNQGFITNGVEPDNHYTGLNFNFQIKYVDMDNDNPITNQIWIDTNNNGNYENNEKFEMYLKSGSNYSNGVIYSNILRIHHSGDGIINYRFYFTDKYGYTPLNTNSPFTNHSFTVYTNEPFTVKTNYTTSGEIGNIITISGSNYGTNQGISSLKIGSCQFVISNWSDTNIVAKIPACAVSGDLILTIYDFPKNLGHFEIVTEEKGLLADNLDNVIAGPIPIKIGDGQLFRFEKLTSKATIKVYTFLGELVQTLEEIDGDGKCEWNLKNKDGELIGKGVYICEISNDKGERKFIKIAVIK